MASSSAARQRIVFVLVAIIVVAIVGPLGGKALAALPPAGGGQVQASGGPVAAAASEAKAARPATLSVGYDISWPQCPQNEQPSGVVNWVILGVTGGQPTNLNPCLAEQAQWAKSSGTLPQLYMNVAGVPAGYNSPYCAASDTPCQAYQYGANSAASSLAYATASGITAGHWWLDVETGNFWTSDHFLNERVIAGAIERLQASGRTVGIYSTPRQWSTIAGGYEPQLHVWTAGAQDLAEATTRCNPEFGFGGGPVELVQYVSEQFDMSYVCPLILQAHRVTVGLVSHN